MLSIHAATFDIAVVISYLSYFFFFNDTATTEIYTLSLHDALPICSLCGAILPLGFRPVPCSFSPRCENDRGCEAPRSRSEEHTSELQSQSNLVCRLLLEKKKHQRSGELGLATIEARVARAAVRVAA